MKYLTVEQVLFLHARLVEETGGSHGIRDLGLLESAVARPQATFEGEDLYSDIFAKAAALMHSLVGNHPFVDGNKRTGLAAVVLLLRVNGWSIEVSNPELEGFTWQVARGKLDLIGAAAWLRERSIHWERQP